MYPPEVINALKQALAHVYWYKDDLRLFMKACDIPPELIAWQGWHDQQEYMIHIAGTVLSELVAMGPDGLGPIRRMTKALLDMGSLDHLRMLEDADARISRARTSIERLRKLVFRHDGGCGEAGRAGIAEAQGLAPVPAPLEAAHDPSFSA